MDDVEAAEREWLRRNFGHLLSAADPVTFPKALLRNKARVPAPPTPCHYRYKLGISPNGVRA